MISNIFKKIAQSIFYRQLDFKSLELALQYAKKNNIIDTDSYKFASAAIHMNRDRVRDIMTPRSQVVYIGTTDKDSMYIINTMIDSGFSRFPLIGKEDKILGLLLLKDLLPIITKQAFSSCDNDARTSYPELPVDIKAEMLHPTLVVPEGRKITSLLKEMRSKHKQAAVVIDEYGVFSGLVSIEDILEQIVGEIEDEHDTKENNIIFNEKLQGCLVNATTSIEEFNNAFKVDIDAEDFDTVGGLILDRLGHLPKAGETLQESCLILQITKSNERKIIEVLVKSVNH